jgi:single-strand DNA-binding protein
MILITIPDGRLCADPRINDLQSGSKVANLRVASNYRTKDGDEWVSEALFFDVECWKSVDAIAQYFTKGSPIIVWGELQEREWTDQQGAAHKSLSVKNANWTFPPKNDGAGEQSQPAQRQAAPQQAPAAPQYQPPAQTQQAFQPAAAGGDSDIPW